VFFHDSGALPELGHRRVPQPALRYRDLDRVFGRDWAVYANQNYGNKQAA
jgi:hypothetical protein